MYVVAQVVDGFGQVRNVFLWLLQQVQGKTKGTAAAYAREGAYGICCFFEEF